MKVLSNFVVVLCAAITFSVVHGTHARADIVYLCEDGSNIVVQNANPAAIAKLHRISKCVRNFHRRLEMANKRRKQRDRYYSRLASATWDICGEPSCHAVGKRRKRIYYERSGPMVAIDYY